MRITTMPPSVNATYRTTRNGGIYKKPEVKEAMEAIAWEMRAQHIGPPMKGALSVSIEVTFKGRRRHDIDNILKQLFDAGTGILWEDDNQIEELHVKKYIGEKEGIELNFS